METDKAKFGTGISENVLGRLMAQVTLPEADATDDENAWDNSVEERIYALELLLQESGPHSSREILQQILNYHNSAPILDSNRVWPNVIDILIYDMLHREMTVQCRYWITKLVRFPRNMVTTARATVISHVARLYFNNDKTIEAETLQRLVLKQKEYLFGANDPVVMRGRIDLAKTYERTGKLDSCETELHTAFQWAISTKGPEHPMTTGIMMWICKLLERKGDMDAFNVIIKRHVAIIQEIHGTFHSKALELLKHLGRTNKIYGRFAEAGETFNRILATYEEMLGLDHADTLRAVVDLANIYSREHCHWHLFKAEALYKRALAGLSFQLGSEDGEVLAVRWKLARMYKKQDRLTDIQALLEPWCMRWRESCKPFQSDVYHMFSLLAKVYVLQDNLPHAAPLLCRALGHQSPVALSVLKQLYAQFRDGKTIGAQAEEFLKTVLQFSNQETFDGWVDLQRKLTSLRAAGQDLAKIRALGGEILTSAGLSEYPDIELNVLHNLSVIDSKSPHEVHSSWKPMSWSNHILRRWRTLSYMQQLGTIDFYYFAICQELSLTSSPKRVDCLKSDAEEVYSRYPSDYSRFCSSTFRTLGIIASRNGDIEDAKCSFKRVMETRCVDEIGEKSDVVIWADTAERLAKIYQHQGRHDVAARLMQARATLRCSHLEGHDRSQVGSFPRETCKKNLVSVLAAIKTTSHYEPWKFQSLMEIMGEPSLPLSTASMYLSDLFEGHDDINRRMQRFLSVLDNSGSLYVDAPSRLVANRRHDTTPALVPGCGLKTTPSMFASDEVIPFEFLKSRGHGSFGHVQEVKSTVNGRMFACKIMRIVYHNKQNIQRMMQDEVKILSGLQHPHIIKVQGSYLTPRECGIIMLPIADGNLEELLWKWGNDEEWTEARKRIIPWIDCLCSAVTYIHSKCIKHKDIKPSNILYKHNRIYLADFGLSVQFDHTPMSTSSGQGGSPMYGAPEAMEDGKRGRSADVFALGCVFMEMCCILQERSVEQFLIARTAHGRTAYHQTLRQCESWFSGFEPFESFVKPMLAIDRHLRPSAEATGEAVRRCFGSKVEWGCFWDCDSTCNTSAELIGDQEIENEGRRSSRSIF